jgi:hypothetical protein
LIRTIDNISKIDISSRKNNQIVGDDLWVTNPKESRCNREKSMQRFTVESQSDRSIMKAYRLAKIHKKLAGA